MQPGHDPRTLPLVHQPTKQPTTTGFLKFLLGKSSQVIIQSHVCEDGGPAAYAPPTLTPPSGKARLTALRPQK